MKKGESRSIVPSERIERAIYIIRGAKVMLDRDLAILFGIETRALVQAVKRNQERFPEDFMFQLTKNEFENYKSQIVIYNSKNKTSFRKSPFVFTEQGVAMLSSVLRSPQAVKINIEIMRAFIRLNQSIASHKEIAKELFDLKAFTLKHSHANDREFKRIWQAIEKLSNPPFEEPRKIGFDTSL